MNLNKEERLRNKEIMSENNKTAQKAFLLGIFLLILFVLILFLFPKVIQKSLEPPGQTVVFSFLRSSQRSLAPNLERCLNKFQIKSPIVRASIKMSIVFCVKSFEP
jgi:hypothetical protein